MYWVSSRQVHLSTTMSMKGLEKPVPNVFSPLYRLVGRGWFSKVQVWTSCHHTKGTIPHMYLSTPLQESSDVIISGLRSELSSLNQKLEEMTSYHQVTMQWMALVPVVDYKWMVLVLLTCGELRERLM